MREAGPQLAPRLKRALHPELAADFRRRAIPLHSRVFPNTSVRGTRGVCALRIA